MNIFNHKQVGSCFSGSHDNDNPRLEFQDGMALFSFFIDMNFEKSNQISLDFDTKQEKNLKVQIHFLLAYFQNEKNNRRTDFFHVKTIEKYGLLQVVHYVSWACRDHLNKRTQGWVGGSENGNFHLSLCTTNILIRRQVVSAKKPQKLLRNS